MIPVSADMYEIAEQTQLKSRLQEEKIKVTVKEDSLLAQGWQQLQSQRLLNWLVFQLEQWQEMEQVI